MIEHLDILSHGARGGFGFAFAGHEGHEAVRGLPAKAASAAPKAAGGLPQRPDDTVINGTIPLFYIGRNRDGFWVARAADGRSGGLFVLKRSAVRFARECCEPAGCALMFPTEPLELDAAGQAGEPDAAPAPAATPRKSLLAAACDAIAARWRALIAAVSQTLAAERRNRAAIQSELFADLYTLSSKNDDDLPVQ